MKNNILYIYLNYLSKINSDKNYVPNTEENTAIYNITNDVKYADLMNQLKGITDFNSKKKIIIDYIAEEEMKKSKGNKDLISKIYGVNIENIDSVKLDNGKEVFAFYDEKIGRKRLIENLGEESLMENLKEVQNNNIEFQTNDYKKNSENILKSQAEQNNNRQELKMVDINEYISHPENYGVLDEDTRSIINKVYNSKDDLKIKYINVENKVLLTEDHKVIEISKTKDGNYVLNQPIKWQQNVDEVDNEIKVEENEKNVDDVYENDYSIDSNSFEDEPEFISAEEIESEIKASNISLPYSTEEIKDKIKKYYDNPIEMENIEDESEKSFFNRMVNEIYAIRKTNYEKKKEQKMSMVYKNTDLNNSGFVNLIFISILLLFLAFVLFIGL
ncbi:MAG: hypothetical protein J6O56_05665 [Bacilli bacterium]|nr:hypothetical protein [Bacilli bacterium]